MLFHILFKVYIFILSLGKKILDRSRLQLFVRIMCNVNLEIRNSGADLTRNENNNGAFRDDNKKKKLNS